MEIQAEVLTGTKVPAGNCDQVLTMIGNFLNGDVPKVLQEKLEGRAMESEVAGAASTLSRTTMAVLN